MSYICSAGLGIPEHVISQDRVKEIIKQIFPYSSKELRRLLPVFDHAQIKNRQLAVDEEWLTTDHTFEERNKLYHDHAIKYSLQAIDHCLTNKLFLKEEVPCEAVDMIIFVSSTGIATPSLDAVLMNERPFREDVSRMPLWGLGCAGGAIGLSRAHDWLSAHPEKTALVICCELCSLTFQREDVSKSNLIGTALFGDGASASLLVGQESPYLAYSKKSAPEIKQTNSFTKKDSTSVMGWDVTNNGLEVIFSKSIPALVKTLWKEHVISFLHGLQLSERQISTFIAHPGGKKVLKAMEESLNIPEKKLADSYFILEKHGNMSSATVLYVLYQSLKKRLPTGELSILCALGPGFSSELLLLEWG